MNKKSEIKLGIALLIIASLLCGAAEAQVPVTDSQNTKSTIKNWFTNLKESKVVVSTMQTAKKTSAAIGTAKKAVSEYVVENKRKIEEKMAKVQEYKEKAEKYKKDYEKYKSQLDEGIAKAKEMKEKAEEGIQTAKDAANAAKGMAASAKDMANSKIGAVSDKLGIEKNNAGEAAAPEAQTAAADNETSAAGENGAAAATPQMQAPDVASPTGSPAEVATTRRPFVSGGSAVSTAAGNSAAVTTVGAARPVASGIAVEGAAPNKQIPANAAKLKNVSGVKPAAAKTLSAVSGAVAVTDKAVAEKTAVKATAGSQPAAARVKAVAQPASLKAGTVSDDEKVSAPAADKIKRKSLRRTFTTSSLEGSAAVSGLTPVGFAFATELPDDCSDVNNTRLFPRTTCMYCNLSSAKVKEPGVVDECLLDINKESAKAQVYSGRDAPAAYRKGKLEIAAVMIAESYQAANKAETFYDNKVAPIAEAPETVEQDALANLVEFNKVVDEQLNDLLQLYSSKLALQAYLNYGEYNFKPEDEDEDDEE